MFKGRQPRIFTAHARTTIAGYRQRWLPGHPRAYDGYVMEHVLSAESKLGRPLSDDEHVHHIDGDKLNNHPDNLMVLSNSEHATLHAEQRRKQ